MFPMAALNFARRNSKTLKRYTMNTPWISVLTLGVACGSVIVASPNKSVDDRAQAAATLAKEVSRAKKVGNPLSAVELIPTKPKDNENAFFEFRKSEKLSRSEPMRSYLNSFQEFVSQKDFARAEQLSPKLEPVLSLARQAAAKPAFLSDRDYDSIIDDSFPMLAQSRSLVKTLCFQAMLDCHQNRMKDGLENLSAALALSKHAGREPSVISLLVQVATHAIVLRAAERIASEHRTNEEFLGRLSSILEPPSLNLLKHLRAEAYEGTTMIRNLDRLDGLDPFATVSGGRPKLKPGAKPLLRKGLPNGLTERASLARHLAIWNDVFEHAQKNSDPLTFSAWMESKFLKLQDRKGKSYDLVKDSFASFEQLGVSVAKSRAIQETTVAFIKVLQFKSKSGVFPKDLAEAGFTELDPFTKKSYKMVVDGENVRVYSVGPNKKDELGQNGAATTKGAPSFDDVCARTDRDGKPSPVQNSGTE